MFSHGVGRAISLVSLLIRAPVLSDQGFKLLTSFNLSHLLKGPISKTVTWGVLVVTASTCECRSKKSESEGPLGDPAASLLWLQNPCLLSKWNTLTFQLCSDMKELETLPQKKITLYNLQCHLLEAGKIDILLLQKADFFKKMKLSKLNYKEFLY